MAAQCASLTCHTSRQAAEFSSEVHLCAMKRLQSLPHFKKKLLKME